jgi:hypothetical protein
MPFTSSPKCRRTSLMLAVDHPRFAAADHWRGRQGRVAGVGRRPLQAWPGALIPASIFADLTTRGCLLGGVNHFTATCSLLVEIFGVIRVLHESRVRAVHRDVDIASTCPELAGSIQVLAADCCCFHCYCLPLFLVSFSSSFPLLDDGLDVNAHRWAACASVTDVAPVPVEPISCPPVPHWTPLFLSRARR